jgi:hypothetical protein
MVGSGSRNARAISARAGRLAPQPVDGPVTRGGDDPAGRAGRQARFRPPPGGFGERVLHGVFGRVDVTENPGQHGHRPAVLGPEDPLDVGPPRQT